MEHIIKNGIKQILRKHKHLLRIAIRQRAKFEGWLKFELASYLERIGMDNVEVESKLYFNNNRADISFYYNGIPYCLELKTPNTSWIMSGIESMSKPITKNILSIINDARKLKDKNGIIAFVLFPVPINDNRWETYLNRIQIELNITINKENNCLTYVFKYNERDSCNLVICVFKT